MTILLTALFLIGYLMIALEEKTGINKSAAALLTAVLCWTLLILGSKDLVSEELNRMLEHYLGNIAGILFFLLGAMTIVELIDAHDGFEIIAERIRTNSFIRLLWLVCAITFFLSAVLDNLTTAIVMVSLVRKLVRDSRQRLLFAGMIVIAANAGGAWSPIGDVTTTMLWIGGQLSAFKVMKALFIPSLVNMLVPLMFLTIKHKRTKLQVVSFEVSGENDQTKPRHRNLIFFCGISALVMVPVFKTITHLPPYMGILLGLGLMWTITEWLYKGKSSEDKQFYIVAYAIRKADTPSILFFLGILLSISALETAGLLEVFAHWMEASFQKSELIVFIMGLSSAIVDNVPLVAASMGMYSIDQYPLDHSFWHFMAYCTGTGGSILVIGSAAGVAAMGLEKIEFVWYLKKIAWLAFIGYVAGALVYLI